MDRVKRIWYLSPMRAAKVQASLRIRAVSPEPSLLAHTSSESRGTFRQKARSLAPLNGWACAVEICHDGMLEDTISLYEYTRLGFIECSWVVMINATLLMSLADLSAVLYIRNHDWAHWSQRDQKIQSTLWWSMGRLLGPRHITLITPDAVKINTL